MRIGIIKELSPTERRVPLVPDSVKRLGQKKISVVVEAGAGAGSLIADDEYVAVGAELLPSRQAVLDRCDLLLRLAMPSIDDIAGLRPGSALVAPILPLSNPELVAALASRGVDAVAIDSIPRTTVAQMMDVLSSQATCAGYYAVLAAAAALPRFFPMLITAAGTIAPAKVLVLGAGVAGLQAIGTARRLGAVVEVFDVRRVVKEQVESLGARFVEVDPQEDAQTAGGYAKEVSEDYKRKQAEAIARHVAKSDVCICTALIPGRRAPILITADMVAQMKPGSVIVDLAAEQKGNCELTESGRTVVKHGVTILGALDVPSNVAVHASQMYSRNAERLLIHLSKDGVLRLDQDDEIARGCVIVRGGEVVAPALKAAAAQTGGAK
jgi:NAD(P) transhydrogenase subunit alpha